MLKAIKPEIVKASKPKFMISGKSGVGKTFFALSFERPYFIDTEGGGDREQYIKKLITNEGGYFGKEQGSQDFHIVLEEIKQLATTRHGYKTLIIDSFSKLYNVTAATAEETVGNDYGRDRKEANKPTRQLMRWLEKLDMTVILICHHKDKWERKGKESFYSGSTFDGWDKMEYDLDLWIEVLKIGKERSFTIKKSRIDSMQEGLEYTLDYKKFCELYGEEIIQAPVKPTIMASAEQVAEIKKMIELVRLDDDTVKKWLSKAEADSFEEMSTEQIAKCIQFIKSKLVEAKV